MAFVKDHLRIQLQDFTFQIAISEHLKLTLLLRSMPQESLDNASNSFPSKLKILDRNLFSQNVRGRLHRTDVTLTTLLEKRRQASWVYVPTLTSRINCQASLAAL